MQIISVGADVVQDVAMVLHDTLRLSGRAGSVEDVSEPLGFDCRQIDGGSKRILIVDIDQTVLECAGRAKRRPRFEFASIDLIQGGVGASLCHSTPKLSGATTHCAVGMI